MAVSKDHLNKLIQQLSDDALPIAADFLEKLTIGKYQHIPWDDEPTTQEDLTRLKKPKKHSLVVRVSNLRML